MKKIALLAGAALLATSLAGCATTGTVAPADKPHIAPPSAVSLQDCLLPVNLPPGDMTQQQIEKYWGTDRAHQIDCARRHKILADYIRQRDAGLTGDAK